MKHLRGFNAHSSNLIETRIMTTQKNAGNTAVLRLFSSNSMRATLSQLVPHFERENGHSVSIVYDLASVTVQRILDGETGDVVIVNANAMEELVSKGRVVAGGHGNLAQSGVGVAVRAGTPRPDVSTIDAFRRALLDAKSIAHTTGGESGLYFARLIERLGITAQVQAKTRTRPSGIIGKLLVSGEAEMAIQFAPQLLEVSGIDFVGPLPRELQVISVMAAGILTAATQPETARMLLRFLTSQAAQHMFKLMGYDLCAP